MDRLRAAVAKGIITAAQLDAILGQTTAPGAEAAPHEARRGLNAVTIAYSLGAGAVVLAFGWFLGDRWTALGAPGVLIVSLLYAGVFAATARYLTRLRFPTAAAVATLLTVCMTPLVTWAVLDLSGWWYEPSRMPMGKYVYMVYGDVLENLRWIPIELATAGVALLALRRVQFGILVIPVAVALPLIAGHLAPLVFDPMIANEMTGWTSLVTASVLIACAYGIDTRMQDGEDYARWVYLTGLCTLIFGVVSVWNELGPMRHALPVVAAALFALSLYMRRPMLLVFGALLFIGYLAYLAFDVFRQALSFPVVLATFGTSVIVLTVWLQKRYPSLARQVEERHGGRRTVPGGWLAFGGGIAIALALSTANLSEARQRAHDRAHYARYRVLRDRRAARTSPGIRGGAGRVTVPPTQTDPGVKPPQAGRPP